MSDPIKLEGFQKVACNAIPELSEEAASKLPVEWPLTLGDVLDHLINTAGMQRGSSTNTAASQVWDMSPHKGAQASASMQVTVAMPTQPVEDPDSKVFGKWANKRTQRSARYDGLMRGSINVKAFTTFGDALYYMFADLANLIGTVKVMADQVKAGTFEIEDDQLRQALRTWRRERELGQTLNLTDAEREENWTSVGRLLNPAFRELLESVAAVYEARQDMVAFDDNAVRSATGGKTSTPRLQRTFMAAAQFVAENLKKLTETMDSQVDLREEIDAALVFLRAKEVQMRCGVLEYSEETADAGVAKVLQRFGNPNGAPAIQLGYDYRELFFRMGDVLQDGDGQVDVNDLFYLGEASSAIQSDASFVEFGIPEEAVPAGEPFRAKPMEPARLDEGLKSTGFTRKWQVWFLKAKLDFGFSFSESRQ